MIGDNSRLIEAVARGMCRISWPDETRWRAYVVHAKAAIAIISDEVSHEAQDTEFDTGFEAFRKILKKATI